MRSLQFTRILAVALAVLTLPFVGSVAASATQGRLPPPGGDLSPPPAPTAVIGTPHDGEIELRWVAPRTSVPVVAYRAYALGHPGGCTTDGATSCVVGAVPGGVPHSFVVEAVTAAGTGPESSPSTAVMAGRPPGTPTGAAARIQGSSARVSWRAPLDSGDLPGTVYRVSSRLGYGCVAAAPALACSVEGLPSGVVQRFWVTASNAMGDSGPSVPTDGLTPGAPAPSHPIAVEAAFDAASGSILVAWRRPLTAGMAPVTSFTATAGTHGSCTVPAERTGCVIPPVPPGRRPVAPGSAPGDAAPPQPAASTTVLVRASNEFGAGEGSAEVPLSADAADRLRPRVLAAQRAIQPEAPAVAIAPGHAYGTSSPPGESYAVLARPSALASGGLTTDQGGIASMGPVPRDGAAETPSLTQVRQARRRRGALIVTWAVPRPAHGHRVAVTLSPGDRQCSAAAARGFCLIAGLHPGQGYSAIARTVTDAGWSAESAPTPQRALRSW